MLLLGVSHELLQVRRIEVRELAVAFTGHQILHIATHDLGTNLVYVSSERQSQGSTIGGSSPKPTTSESGFHQRKANTSLWFARNLSLMLLQTAQ